LNLRKITNSLSRSVCSSKLVGRFSPLDDVSPTILNEFGWKRRTPSVVEWRSPSVRDTANPANVTDAVRVSRGSSVVCTENFFKDTPSGLG